MFFNSLKQKFQVRGFFLKCVNFAHPLTKVPRYATDIYIYITQRFYRIYCRTIVSRFHDYQKQINQPVAIDKHFI